MTGLRDNGDGTITISKRMVHVVGSALLVQAFGLFATGISMYVELQVLKAKVEDMAESIREMKGGKSAVVAPGELKPGWRRG